MRRTLSRLRALLLAGLLLATLAGCVPASFAQTPFQQQTGDAASLVSAAAASIEFAHTGKLDDRYARSSLSIYRDMLAKLPDLAELRGAPDDGSATDLSTAIDDAAALLDDPCLSDDCDWQGQVDTLQATAQSLELAGS